LLAALRDRSALYQPLSDKSQRDLRSSTMRMAQPGWPHRPARPGCA